ncbi:MAG: endonuclease/exonuclease/phosphatase family protein [Brevundimonas sp.]|uniref:endonuclease/exonuclease/phosphatase family protein n=1 Tax=Brevundimonas sp. TaxID=1871086 RepID=UPI003002511A
MLARLKAIFLSVWPVLVCLMLVGPWLIPAVAHFSGIGHRWVDIMAQFTAPALIGALVATVLVAFLKRPPLMGVALVGLMVCVIAVLPQAEPARGAPDRSAPVLTVYSANLNADNGDVEAISASIRDANADIVILIEVSPAAFAARQDILADYPYQRASETVVPPGSRGSVIIAARYPLSPVDMPRDQLSALHARADTPLGPLHLAGVHMTRPWPFQYQWGQIIQAQLLADRLARVTDPILVAGDFNTVSSARIGRQIKAQTGLTPAGAWPGTWPTELPSWLGIGIDHQWRSDELVFLSRRIGKRTGSDHYPLVTRITLSRSQSSR